MESEELILFFISGIVMKRAAWPYRTFCHHTPKTLLRAKRTNAVFRLRDHRYSNSKLAITCLLFSSSSSKWKRSWFPWATVLKDTGMTAFIEILVFLAILGIGLLYAWKKQALRWQ